MLLDVTEDMFNNFKINMYLEKNELEFSFKKNLKDTDILTQVDEIKWKDKFHVKFTEKRSNYRSENNEFFWDIVVPLDKIEWIKFGPVIETACQWISCNGVPEIVVDEIKKAPIQTNKDHIKGIECNINDFKFIPEYRSPIRWLDIEVPNNDGSYQMVDLSQYDLTNIDAIVVFGMYQFDIINIPSEFEESYKFDDGIAIKITPKFGSSDKNLVKFDEFIPISRNIVKFVRKGV